MGDTTIDGFVGRVAEIEVLDALLERAASGIGGCVLISGEAGIGKTALARHAFGRARAEGFQVAWAACWQTASVPPLWPWTQLLGQVAGTDEAPDLVSGYTDVDVAQAEQLGGVTSWLRRRADVPILLVIDDLQWADAASVNLLTHVAAVAPAARLLVVVTARPTEGAGERFAAAWLSLRRWGTVLELGGLALAETRDLVRAVAGDATASGEEVEYLHVLSGGHPLFVRELGRTLVARGSVAAGGEVEIPGSVHDIVADRILRLAAGGQQLLQCVAVLGDEAPIEVVAEVVGLEPRAALAVADEAVRAGLLLVGAGAVSFDHALFRAAVYDALSVAARADLHDRIGRALLSRRSSGVPVEVAALAHHFGRSAPLGNAATAFEFSVAAAREAEAMLAFDLAARRWQQALAMLAVAPGAGDRLATLLSAADALGAAGDSEGARQAFLDAAAAARAVGDPVALGRAALGASGGMGGIEVQVGDREVCALLDAALAGLGGDVVLGPLVQARLSVALSYLEPLAVRVELAQAARAAALDGGDPASIAHASAAVCDVVAGPDHLTDRLDLTAEIIAGATRCGDVKAETLGRRLRVEALLEAGDLAGAESEVDRYDVASRRLGRAEYTWYPALWRAALAYGRGDLSEHRQWSEELERRSSAAGGVNAGLLALVHETSRYLDLDDTAAGRAVLAEFGLTDGLALEVQFAVTVARFRDSDDRSPAALAEVERLTEHALRADLDSEWLPMMVQLAECVTRLQLVELAPPLLEALDPFAAVWSIEGIGAGVRGPTDRVLGSLRALAGDTAAAEQHFDAARLAAARAGAALLVAVVDRDRSRAFGTPLDEGAADLLRAFGASEVAAPAPAAREAPAVGRFDLAGDTWTITFAGAMVSLRHRKGLGDLAQLLSTPRREIASLDLMGDGSGVIEQGVEVLDAKARDAYRARVIEIEDELDEADANADAGRSARLLHERDALLQELSGAYGLGGRIRSAGGSAERARTAVRSRIRDALQRIEDVHPDLGTHLRRSVRTGAFCVYDPDPLVEWQVIRTR